MTENNKLESDTCLTYRNAGVVGGIGSAATLTSVLIISMYGVNKTPESIRIAVIIFMAIAFLLLHIWFYHTAMVVKERMIQRLKTRWNIE